MRKFLNALGLFFAFAAFGIGGVTENFGWLTFIQMCLCSGVAICLVTAAEKLLKDREDHLQDQVD